MSTEKTRERIAVEALQEIARLGEERPGFGRSCSKVARKALGEIEATDPPVTGDLYISNPEEAEERGLQACLFMTMAGSDGEGPGVGHFSINSNPVMGTPVIMFHDLKRYFILTPQQLVDLAVDRGVLEKNPPGGYSNDSLDEAEAKKKARSAKRKGKSKAS